MLVLLATPRNTCCVHIPPGPWPCRLSAGTQLKDSMSLPPQGPAPGRRSPTVSHQPNHGRGCARPGDSGCPVTQHDMGF